MEYRNIERLYNVAYASIFTFTGKLSYDRVTDCLVHLADMVAETETNEFTLTDIGEHNEACLADLIIGAYWHYSERHGGQSSKGYAALSALGRIYWPNMETGPEPDTGENCAYEMLNLMVVLSNARVFDNGGESMDRYTLFPYLQSDDALKRVMFIGFSEGGNGVSMWGELNNSDISNLSFLGKEISFYELSKDSQNHIVMRVQ
jgi:hypothetical protein